MSNFSPFCRALLPFRYCLLLTGTFLHYYQEARVGIDTYVYYLLATCLYLNSSDRLPDTRTTSNGRTDMVHKPRWQPLGYLSRKLRNKSILLQASLFLHRLEREALVIIFKKPSLGGTRKSQLSILTCCRLLNHRTLSRALLLSLTNLV